MAQRKHQTHIRAGEEVIEAFVEQHAEYTHDGTTWNKAARQTNQKCKLCTTVTLEVMAPHPGQVPSLLN